MVFNIFIKKGIGGCLPSSFFEQKYDMKFIFCTKVWHKEELQYSINSETGETKETKTISLFTHHQVLYKCWMEKRVEYSWGRGFTFLSKQLYWHEGNGLTELRHHRNSHEMSQIINIKGNHHVLKEFKNLRPNAEWVIVGFPQDLWNKTI